MIWVDYGGQDVAGYDRIGTDTLQYQLDEVSSVDETVDEIKRRCGHLARIKLFKKAGAETDGDR